MATLDYGSTAKSVFTPLSSALTTAPAGPATMIALVKLGVAASSGMDGVGLTDAALGNWYHTLGLGNAVIFDDDGLVGVSSPSIAGFNTTDWFWIAVDWGSGAGTEGMHWRNHSTGGSWTHLTSGTNGGTSHVPALTTGGWLRIGTYGDNPTAHTKALVAIWAGTRFATTDYASWVKTSDLWNHALGNPTFLCECNSVTLSDLAAGSTFSSANSTPAPTLTGADPTSWTFDGTGIVVDNTTKPGRAGMFSPQLRQDAWF